MVQQDMKKQCRNRTAASSRTRKHSCSTGLGGRAGASGQRVGMKSTTQPQASKMSTPHISPHTEHNNRQVSTHSSSLSAERKLLEGRWTLRLRDPKTGRSAGPQQKCATARGISVSLSEPVDSTSLPATHRSRRKSEQNRASAETPKIEISSRGRNSHGKDSEGDVVCTLRQAKAPSFEVSGVHSLGPRSCISSTFLQPDSRQPTGDICFSSSLTLKERNTSNCLQPNTNIAAGSEENVKYESSQAVSSFKVSKIPSALHGSDICQRKGTTPLKKLVTPELPTSSLEMASYDSSDSPLITRSVQRLPTSIKNLMKRRLSESPPFSSSPSKGENQRLILSQPVDEFKGFSSVEILNRKSKIDQCSRLNEMQKELRHYLSGALSHPCPQGKNTGKLCSPSVMVKKVYRSPLNDLSSSKIPEKLVGRSPSNLQFSNALKDLANLTVLSSFPHETNTQRNVNTSVSLSQLHRKLEMPEEHHAKHKALLSHLVTQSELPMNTTPAGPSKNNSIPTAHSDACVTLAGPCRRDTRPAEASTNNSMPAAPPRSTMISTGPYRTNTTQPRPFKNKNQNTPAKPSKNKNTVPVPQDVQNTPAILHKNRNMAVEPSLNQNTSATPSMNQNVPPIPSMNQNTPARPSMNQNIPPKSSVNQNAPGGFSNNQNTTIRPSMNQNAPGRPSMNQNTPARPSKNQITSIEPSKNHNKPSGPFTGQNTSAKPSVNQITPAGHVKNQITPAESSKNQIIPAESSKNQMIPAKSSMNHSKADRDSKIHDTPVILSKNHNTPAGPSMNQNAPSQPSRNHSTHAPTGLTQKDTGLVANSLNPETRGGLSDQLMCPSEYSKEIVSGMPVTVVVKRHRKKTLTKRASVPSSSDAKEPLSVTYKTSVISMNYARSDSEPTVPVKSPTDSRTPPLSSVAQTSTSKELMQPCSILNKSSPAMPLLQSSLCAEYSVRPEMLSMPPLKPVTSAKPSKALVTPTTSLVNSLPLCSTLDKFSSPTIPVLQPPVHVGYSIMPEVLPIQPSKPAKPLVRSPAQHTLASQNPQMVNDFATKGVTVTGLQRKPSHSSNSTGPAEIISPHPQSDDRRNSKTQNELEGKPIHSSFISYSATKATLQIERKASSKHLPVAMSSPVSCTSEEVHHVTCPPLPQGHLAAGYRTKLYPASLEFLPGIRENYKCVKEGQNRNTSAKEELSGTVSLKMSQDEGHSVMSMKNKSEANITLSGNIKASSQVPPLNTLQQKATLQEGCEMREEAALICQRVSEQQSLVRKRKHSCDPESAGSGSLPVSNHATSLEHKSSPKKKRSHNRNIRKDNKNKNPMQNENGPLPVKGKESKGEFILLQRSCTIQMSSPHPSKKGCKIVKEKDKGSGGTSVEKMTEAGMEISQSQHHSPLKQATPTPSIPSSPEPTRTKSEVHEHHRGIVLSPKVIIVRINEKVIKNATKKVEEAELKKTKAKEAVRKRAVRVRNVNRLDRKKTKVKCVQGSSENKTCLSISNTSSIPTTTGSLNVSKITTEKDTNVHKGKNKDYSFDDKGIFISQKLDAETPCKLPNLHRLGVSIKRKAPGSSVVDILFKKLQLDQETTKGSTSLESQTSGDLKLATPPPPSQLVSLEHPTPGNIITYLPRLSQALESLPMSRSKIIKNQQQKRHLPDASSLPPPAKLHNSNMSGEVATNKNCNTATESDKKIADKDPQPRSCQLVISEKEKDLEDFDIREKAVTCPGVRRRKGKREKCRRKDERVNKVEGKEDKEEFHQVKQRVAKRPNKQPPQEENVVEKQGQQMEGGVNVTVNLMEERLVEKQNQQVEVNEKQNKGEGRVVRKRSQMKENTDEREKQVEVQVEQQCHPVKKIMDEKQGRKLEERAVRRQNKPKLQRRSHSKECQYVEEKVDGKQSQAEGRLECKQRQEVEGKVDGKQSQKEGRLECKQRQEVEGKVNGKQSQKEGRLECKQRQEVEGKVDGKQSQMKGRLDGKQRQQVEGKVDGKQRQVEGRLEDKERWVDGKVVKTLNKHGKTCPSVQRETRSMNKDSQIHNKNNTRKRKQNIPEKRMEELEETSTHQSKRTQFDHTRTIHNTHLPTHTLHTGLTQPYTSHTHMGTAPTHTQTYSNSTYTPVPHIQTHMNINPTYTNSNQTHSYMYGLHMYANTPRGHVNLPHAYINTPHMHMNTLYTHNPYIHKSETCAHTSLTYSHINTPSIYMETPESHTQRSHIPAYMSTPDIHMNTPSMYKDLQYTHKATNVRFTPSNIHKNSSHIQMSTADMDMRTPYKYTHPYNTPSATVCPTPSRMQAKIDKYKLHSYRLLRARLHTARR